VEFVEYQEVEVLGGGDEGSFLRPGEDQLEHDIIRQQDVWRVRDDLSFLLARFLPGITREGYRPLPIWIAMTQELLQFALLAVGEGVHRVHDDSLDTTARSTAEDVIHDGDNVGQTLARARTGRQDIVMAGTGDLDCICLVFVEAQRLSMSRALRCLLLLN
jgi:hypothetical protein